jgi:hypothetical protein
MQQCGELLLLPFLCCSTHALQSLGHAFAALCRSHVWLSDVLLGLRPSLQALRSWLPSLVRTLHRYYTRVRLLAGLPAERLALAFFRRSVAIPRDSFRPGLPVLVHDVSGRARGLRLRRVARGLRASAHVRVVFAVRYRIDTLEFFFHSSIPGLSVPLSTLRLQPRDWRSKTRGQDGSLLLSCKTLAFLTSCRFIPALNEPNFLLSRLRLQEIGFGFRRGRL